VGRSSDTRQRTREAAAELVAGGHRAYAITVDLIYAAIGQGSRTTINDELKRWKDEQARAAALEADWPPVVADGMRALWVLAVEHGERVFEQRRAEVEAQLATAHEELARAESARAQLLATQERVSEQVGTLSEHLAEVRQQLRAETAAKNDAVAHAHALQEELNAARQDSARQLESIRQEQEKQAADFQQAIAARDAAFRAELDTATQRLESAQAHMLQQIDAARLGQRRAESQAANLQLRRDQLQSELAELKMQCGVQVHELKQRSAALDQATAAATRWAAERQTLMSDLANTRGRCEGLEQTVRSLEARATAAETRLAEALTRGDDTKPAPRSGRRGRGA
jgi:chromosome segregation ATPase